MDLKKCLADWQAFSLSIMCLENDEGTFYCIGKICHNSNVHNDFNLLA